MKSTSLYEKNASEESMGRHPNWDLYKARVEPASVKKGEKFIDPRTSDDLERINALERELIKMKKTMRDPVLVPWISPPFGRIVGYGIYSQEEANRLASLSKEWGYPTVGEEYDLDWFSWKIKELTAFYAKRQGKKR